MKTSGYRMHRGYLAPLMYLDCHSKIRKGLLQVSSNFYSLFFFFLRYCVKPGLDLQDKLCQLHTLRGRRAFGSLVPLCLSLMSCLLLREAIFIIVDRQQYKSGSHLHLSGIYDHVSIYQTRICHYNRYYELRGLMFNNDGIQGLKNSHPVVIRKRDASIVQSSVVCMYSVCVIFVIYYVTDCCPRLSPRGIPNLHKNLNF